MMKKASDEKDMDDFREVTLMRPSQTEPFANVRILKAFQIYTKAAPDVTYVDIEKKMREEGFKVFLIALVRLQSRLPT